MKCRYGPLLLSALLAVALAAGPGIAGGAWPRGKDRGFVSLSYSTSGDIIGYVRSMSARGSGVEPPHLRREIGFYLEYGLSDHMTFGIDRYVHPGDHTFGAIWFLRRNFTLDYLPGNFGLEFGGGGYRDERGILDTQFRAGASWGQGVETRWMDGWVEVDAKIGTLEKTGSVIWKVDSTLGIKPGERSLLYLQLQSGALDGFAAYTRAVPTYVRKFGHGISLESALLIGLRNEDNDGVKIGAWVEF